MMIRKPPTAEHLLGTDEFGRDVLSRLIYGSRISLQVGLIAVSISLVAGGAIGAAAGYFGGKMDNFLMRVMDVQLAIPTILLAIVISSALGPGLFNLMVAVGITSIPRFARLMRASVLSIKNMEFIEAARAMGASHLRVILLYILPNCMAPLIVQSTLSVANAILFAATLSFLGLGIQPPFPEWGGMLSAARPYLRNSAYLSIFPGLAIMITIVSLNCIGDGLRDALDPKQKR
jgi:peptide/nickel transport system permease protein